MHRSGLLSDEYVDYEYERSIQITRAKPGVLEVLNVLTTLFKIIFVVCEYPEDTYKLACCIYNEIKDSKALNFLKDPNTYVKRYEARNLTTIPISLVCQAIHKNEDPILDCAYLTNLHGKLSSLSDVCMIVRPGVEDYGTTVLESQISSIPQKNMQETEMALYHYSLSNWISRVVPYGHVTPVEGRLRKDLRLLSDTTFMFHLEFGPLGFYIPRGVYIGFLRHIEAPIHINCLAYYPIESKEETKWAFKIVVLPDVVLPKSFPVNSVLNIHSKHRNFSEEDTDQETILDYEYLLHMVPATNDLSKAKMTIRYKDVKGSKIHI